MNRTYLLALFLSRGLLASAQKVVLPYNPDANQDSATGRMAGFTASTSTPPPMARRPDCPVRTKSA